MHGVVVSIRGVLYCLTCKLPFLLMDIKKVLNNMFIEYVYMTVKFTILVKASICYIYALIEGEEEFNILHDQYGGDLLNSLDHQDSS